MADAPDRRDLVLQMSEATGLPLEFWQPPPPPPADPSEADPHIKQRLELDVVLLGNAYVRETPGEADRRVDPFTVVRCGHGVVEQVSLLPLSSVDKRIAQLSTGCGPPVASSCSICSYTPTNQGPDMSSNTLPARAGPRPRAPSYLGDGVYAVEKRYPDSSYVEFVLRTGGHEPVPGLRPQDRHEIILDGAVATKLLQWFGEDTVLLTADVMRGLRNLGIDPECPVCISVFFTGGADTTEHSDGCGRYPR